MIEKIGNVSVNYDFYSGEDLYSDGDEMENKILQIVKNESGYEYCHEKYNEWPVLYHLTRQRENIVEPMDIQYSDEILEIGSGMGAVTGALARKGKSVDCIELSKRRSMVNAYRHKDMDNIQIYVGNFQDIVLEKKYDVITLIGVLEYGYHYIKGQCPYEDFIKKTASMLKPGGRLYIAIENKLGMKYFAGYSEDHLWKPFVGIEGYSKKDKVKTFSKEQIEKLLLENGYKTLYFYYPFPDYKLPTVIYSDDNIENVKMGFPEQSNYDTPVIQMFRMNEAFESLRGSSERKMLSNSFLVEAKKE
ncbi:MAG: class I SAM-dependent methyltransferase [Lachnospiraceae bacterium]|nr:class I SAM-dependent methyltransferase [Lachnospiraceae bacterium]